jgi:hypothetical protein
MRQAPLVYDLNRFFILIQPDRSQVFSIHLHKNPSLVSGFKCQGSSLQGLVRLVLSVTWFELVGLNRTN